MLNLFRISSPSLLSDESIKERGWFLLHLLELQAEDQAVDQPFVCVCGCQSLQMWWNLKKNVLIPLGWTSYQGFFFFFLSKCSVMALSCLFSSLSFFHSVFNLLQNSTFPHLHRLFARGNGACNAVNATITNNSFKKKERKNKRGRNEKFVSYFQDYSFCSLK